MNPFPEYPIVAAYVKSHTRPEDRLAVLGSEPGIYFLADRRPASSHVCFYEMMKSNSYARPMQMEAIQDIERAKPPCVVLVNAPTSWGMSSKSDPMFFKWSFNFVREAYMLDGVIDLISETEVPVFWGEEARKYRPHSPYTVLIFKRKPEKHL